MELIDENEEIKLGQRYYQYEIFEREIMKKEMNKLKSGLEKIGT